ncbi:hypothetical protein [Frankia nepalensis]|uniref:hypothetical protein n=1 Tax=Frankia nepalensis TaxID=1836974 RepID=UPI001EE3A53A|nr:hypothetical protein [Frankia nepalensis]
MAGPGGGGGAPPPAGAAGQLAAIVVPASRPAHNLTSAMELAVSVGAELVALCSGGTEATQVVEQARTMPGLRAAVVDLADGYKNDKLDEFETAHVLGAAPAYLGDLSLKRNLGLLLGAAAGWRSLLFLDDDIRDVEPMLVREAAAGLRHFDAVGMIARDFPDNSVVCHANRLAGGRQDVFVSGSALLVDSSRDVSFFPRIYNEDWFFLFDIVQRGALGATGYVRQLEFDPYANPRRAADEEFGDVLAEGHMALMHAGSVDEAKSPDFWAKFLEERGRFVKDIRRRLEANSGLNHAQAAAARCALRTADLTRSEIRPEYLADYVQHWRADLARWRRLRSRLVAGSSLADGLRALELMDRTKLLGGR